MPQCWADRCGCRCRPAAATRSANVASRSIIRVIFRYFLNLALTDTLPHPSLLTVFRARLGASLYQQIFDGMVAQARADGLVKDRLRLKDATHI